MPYVVYGTYYVPPKKKSPWPMLIVIGLFIFIVAVGSQDKNKATPDLNSHPSAIDQTGRTQHGFTEPADRDDRERNPAVPLDLWHANR